jgi:DNA-binding transcriptional LysR family regulator
MELHHLRTFVAVAEESSVTKAALRLYMTPPTVSGHIKALEDELGVTLFERTARGMVLTPKGDLLHGKAAKILSAAQELVNHATELQAHLIGQLHFGLNATPSFLRVGSLLKALQQACPGIELKLETAVTGKIIESLQNRSLDAGYIFGDSPTAQIATHFLQKVELQIAIPIAWRDKLLDNSWQSLAELPWITSDYYCPFQTITDALFQEQGLEIKQNVWANDENTKLNLLKEGVGLALLVAEECRPLVECGDIVVWDTNPIYCDLNFAYLDRRKDEPLLSALINIMKPVWHDAKP